LDRIDYLSSGLVSVLRVEDREALLARIEEESEEEAARPPLVVHCDTLGTFVARITAFVSISH
jgi:purine nucleoside permease